MAFGIKFKLQFNTVLDDPLNTQVDWVVDILQDGYVGGITLIDGVGDPLRIKLDEFDNLFEPICTTNATLTLLTQSNDQFAEFQEADVFEYTLEVKKDGVLFWQGVYMTEPYRENFTNSPYSVTLKFNDGLSELQYERFDDSGVLRGDFKSVMDILTKCFSFLPFTRKTREMINIFEDGFDDADTRGLFEQEELLEQAFWELDGSDDVIKGENCLEVIRGIMESHKCRIIVSQDIWYIQRIGELFNTSIKFVEYDTAGAVSTNGTIDLRQTIGKFNTYPILLRHMARGNITIPRQYQEVEFRYDSRNITTLNNNIFVNWNFDKGYELQSTAIVPLLWERSSAVNTQLGVDPTGLHLDTVIDTEDPMGATIIKKVLIIEDSMLVKTKIDANPGHLNDILQVNATRETFSLRPSTPLDTTITRKNLLTDNSDHLEIRIKGFLDYTYTDPVLTGTMPLMFNKFTVKLGSNFYNTSNQAWDTNATNRVWHREWGDFWNDVWVDQAQGIKRHQFDITISLANFPSDSVDDLTVTWFIPETMRAPSEFNTSEAISRIDIHFDIVQYKYVSADSTEFSIQKVLGETGSASLRRKRFLATVKHGDGPSSYSVMSMRLPTTNIKTSSWSSRGGSESLPGHDILVITPIFEVIGTIRKVFSGDLYGFIEPHQTIAGIDSKTFALKGWDFSPKRNIIRVKAHSIGAFTPAVLITAQVDLSLSTSTVDSDDNLIGNQESALNDMLITNQGGTSYTGQEIATSSTQVVSNNNDFEGTGGDYPL